MILNLKMELILKTLLGLEKIAANRLTEKYPDIVLTVKPNGLEGLIIVEKSFDKYALMDYILKDVPEVESIVDVNVETRADLKSIVEAVRMIARGKISDEDSFAVRTVRRGKHDFTSLDVNTLVGAVVQEETGAHVNLDSPDKIVRVEIIHDRVGISITDGFQWRKMGPGKKTSTDFFSKISIVQMPYLGSVEGAREIGMRIGRAVQAYEVSELIISPNKIVDAYELSRFIDGVIEGIESRFRIQCRSYARKVERVRVYLQDLYQLIRDRSGEPIIVFEPEGIQLREAASKLKEIFNKAKRVNYLFGSREGIPKGIYRIADLIIDLAPNITLPTELAAPTALAATYTAIAMIEQNTENSI